MMCYKDRAFCASPDCKNECGRQMKPNERLEAQTRNMPIAWHYFCGEHPLVKEKEDVVI